MGDFCRLGIVMRDKRGEKVERNKIRGVKVSVSFMVAERPVACSLLMPYSAAVMLFH